ncbi:hypothetical protein AM493_10250 [Flavobacterium akiainvivens]|uniref:Polysaccharide biosynthesis protein n=1 Tax=Flavobacterium akiainvivens TaxID=1202724 RepID=A0A0M8MIA4_9FLAO|nr:hypothetical protein [Flavobacterium akiainvivens]KOS06367.1 hypothetical protein AM493_10250 [Flavobacterium akiainvivens]SFQ15062.1 hypothetical protein SAMN05444144_101312 [Flavobacterium akiainvivens]
MSLSHNKLVLRLWNSPTFNTWLSYSTRTLSLFIILPLILKQFSEGEVALWYLFATVISLQSLADMGFRMTFIRVISYAMGGATDIKTFTDNTPVLENGPNWLLLGKIFHMMKYIYRRLTVLLFLLFLVFGSLSMIRPISLVEKQDAAWIAWGIIIIISCIKFNGAIYSNFLEGLNKIALVRRWESLTSIGAILTSIIFLLIFKSLLSLVIANQFWVLVNFFRDYKLSHNVEEGVFKKLNFNHQFDKTFFMDIWKPAWRSGLSGFMSNGLSNITSILYAQIGTATNIAAYMLALRLISQIKDVSMAPFYSKIPSLARLRSQGKIAELVRSSQKGMFLSNLVFVIGSITVGVFGDILLRAINSDVQFIDINLWNLLVVAYFVHRYGAMHIQLYITTNHIISHVADGISGIIFIVAAVLLMPLIDLYAIPLAMLAGYLGFYSWYAALYSYRSIKVKFWEFELKAGLIPFSIMVLYFIVINFIYN